MMRLDAVTLELLRNYLHGAVEDMQLTQVG